MPQSMHTSDSKANLNEAATTGQSSTQAGGGPVTGGVGGGSNLNVTSVNSGPQLLSAANHLEIPSNNPNLLSPDILNQRRGKGLHPFCSGFHSFCSQIKLFLDITLLNSYIKFEFLKRIGSRRPSILPVPDMFTSSSFSISGNEDGDECDESEDELDDDVPWRSPSEKIAYVNE